MFYQIRKQNTVECVNDVLHFTLRILLYRQLLRNPTQFGMNHNPLKYNPTHKHKSYYRKAITRSNSCFEKIPSEELFRKARYPVKDLLIMCGVTEKI